MKKISASVIVLLISITLAYAQDSWITHRIDDKVSVKFPNAPKEISPGCFVSAGKDSTVYFCMGLDMKMPGIDSAHLKEYYHTSEATTHLKQIITRGFPDSDVADLKIGTWQGLTSYTTSGINTSTKAKLYVFMFLIVYEKIYIQFVAIPNGKTTTGRDEFFTSLTLDK